MAADSAAESTDNSQTSRLQPLPLSCTIRVGRLRQLLGSLIQTIACVVWKPVFGRFQRLGLQTLPEQSMQKHSDIREVMVIYYSDP